MARPSKFTREQLQQASLKLVDREGLAALTMRSLAAALGTGAMTLYNYVADRAELEALLVEAVAAEIEPLPGPCVDWREELRAIALAMWRAARAHPHVIPLLLTRRSVAQATLAPVEALLNALARSGRSGHELLAAFRTISGFAMGIAQAEVAGPLSLAGDETADEVISRFRNLSPQDYPRLIEIAAAAATSDPEREFRAGLEIVIAGLMSRSRGTDHAD
jgi:AcrR family transcriptional regulator